MLCNESCDCTQYLCPCFGVENAKCWDTPGTKCFEKYIANMRVNEEQKDSIREILLENKQGFCKHCIHKSLLVLGGTL
jgi:hypothetical protein